MLSFKQRAVEGDLPPDLSADASYTLVQQPIQMQSFSRNRRNNNMSPLGDRIVFGR